jgi:glycosyltransferase involved in cell wall biosynthesis
MTLSFFSKRITVDIHEFYALELFEKRIIKMSLKFLYRYFINAIILHSDKTKKLLNDIKYQKKIFEVPHFKYCFNKEKHIKNVGSDVLFAIKQNCINILFFGYMRQSKGIDVLSKAYSSLSPDKQLQFNLIIAGSDPSGLLDDIDVRGNKNISIIARYINDDELIYLFSNIDYVILPYKEISQSGILEMAFYFRRPVLASRISYFQNLFTQYPSFGLLFDNNAEDISRTILLLPSLKRVFYSEKDISRFEQRYKITSFIIDFISFIE